MIHSSSAIGFATLLKKEIMRFWKVKGQTIVSPVINSALYYLVFGLSLSRVIEKHGDFTYLAFLIPGLVALSALNNAIQNSASSVMVSKFHGDLQDLKLIPLSPVLIASAYGAACIVRGFFVGAIVFLNGELFHFIQNGSLLPIPHPFLLIAFLGLGGFIFGNLGIWIGFVSKTFDQVSAFTTFVLLPLTYLGGVFFSLSSLPVFWQKVSYFNPLVFLINGVRYGILGMSDISVSLCLAVSLVFAVLTSFLALRSVQSGSYQRF